MTDQEMEFFIEEMGDMGDEWNLQQVKEVYGDWTLEAALADRKSVFGMHLGNIAAYVKKILE